MTGYSVLHVGKYTCHNSNGNRGAPPFMGSVSSPSFLHILQLLNASEACEQDQNQFNEYL